MNTAGPAMARSEALNISFWFYNFMTYFNPITGTMG